MCHVPHWVTWAEKTTDKDKSPVIELNNEMKIVNKVENERGRESKSESKKFWMQQVTHGIVDDTQKSRGTRRIALLNVRIPSYCCPLSVARFSFSHSPYSLTIRHARSVRFLFYFFGISFSYAWFHLLYERDPLHTEWQLHLVHHLRSMTKYVFFLLLYSTVSIVASISKIR